MSHAYKTMLVMFAFKQLEVLIVVMPVDTWNSRYLESWNIKSRWPNLARPGRESSFNRCSSSTSRCEMEDLRQTQGVHRGPFVKQKDVQQHDRTNEYKWCKCWMKQEIYAFNNLWLLEVLSYPFVTACSKFWIVGGHLVHVDARWRRPCTTKHTSPCKDQGVQRHRWIGDSFLRIYLAK